MDIDKVDFIPSALVEEYHIKVQELLKPVFDDELNEVHETYLDIQRAEALESLGIIQFFQGDWNNAIKHLDQSLSYVQVRERRGLKRIAMTQLLVRTILSDFLSCVIVVYAAVLCCIKQCQLSRTFH